MTVIEAIAAVMADVRSVAKKDRNQAQNFSFRGIDAVVNAVGPALRTHGVLVVPHQVAIHREPVTVGKNGTRMQAVHVDVVYRWYGPEADWLDTHVVAESMDAGDKATSKAMSVALRTCLLQTLALPTDEPDPDHDVYERTAESHDTLQERVGELVARLRDADVDVDADKVYSFAKTSPAAAQKTIKRLTGMLP